MLGQQALSAGLALRTADTLSARPQEAWSEEPQCGCSLLLGIQQKGAHSPISTKFPAHCKGRCLSPQAIIELSLYRDPAVTLETQQRRTQHRKGEACAFLLEPAGSPARPRLPSKFRVG